jgi:hypothetical protein
MKRLVVVLGTVLLVVAFGCDEDSVLPDVVDPDDLSPPLGLLSITGDGKVTLFWWCSNYGDDLDGYVIYMIEGALGGDPGQEVPAGFTALDSIQVAGPCSQQISVDVDGLTNGTTYSFLVVAAKDDWDDISHTSNIIEDTPRPETAGVARLYAKQVDATEAGFEMDDFSVVDCTNLDDQTYDNPAGGDAMCERFDIGVGTRMWLDGINGAEIQDIGYMADWDDADRAPAAGYAATGHSVEAIMGHVYAVKTSDVNYAKIQVTDLDTNDGWIEIKTAYQPQVGNTEYKR